MDENILDQDLANHKTLTKLPKKSLSYLENTRKWAKFFSILYFIGIGVWGLLIYYLWTWRGRKLSEVSYMDFSNVLMFLFLAVPSFFLGLYLYNFSKLAGRIRTSISDDDFNLMLKNLRNFFRFHTLITIAFLIFYVFTIMST